MCNSQNSIEERIKNMIINHLNLQMSPEEIGNSDPIFGIDENGNGLGLDSIDALELVVGLNDEFGIKHQSDDLSIFENVNTIADYIKEKLKGEY